MNIYHSKKYQEKIKINIGTVRACLRRLRALNLLTRPYGISNKYYNILLLKIRKEKQYG